MSASHRLVSAASLLFLLIGCGGDAAETPPSISGRIEHGLRVLTVDPQTQGQDLTIYRGDYVRVEAPGGAPVTITIPDLDVAKTFPVDEGEKAYFKVPNAGRFPFTAGTGGGVLTALELESASYRELNPQEAADYLAAVEPFILDVRTPREFASGRLEGATLIPIQSFQARLGELADRRKEPVFVYCRTGNRSTVAARLMLDAGFEQVVNLRPGLVGWERAGFASVK